MNPLRSLLFLSLSVFASIPALASDPGTIRIAIASDSTAATWKAPRPERGWGQFIGEDFDHQVEVVNFAKPGRSTKTFLEEGLWAKTLACRPNYVLIQFGHNDSHAPDHHEHTDPDGLYSDLLRRFVKETRDAGAVPVLVTPVQRRTTKDTLLPYVAAMKKVAAETHTPLVDLHQLSGDLYAQIGASAQEQLGATKTDTTHFNEQGAKKIAALVAQGLVEAVPALKEHLAGMGK